jgi:hypothetical protein
MAGIVPQFAAGSANPGGGTGLTRAHAHSITQSISSRSTKIYVKLTK